MGPITRQSPRGSAVDEPVAAFRGLSMPASTGSITATYAAPADVDRRGALAAGAPKTRRPAWALTFAAAVACFLILANLPFRTAIPPLVESDYCYQLIAADRLYDELGLTSLQPVAPRQPWAWQHDWTFLTRWPIGYPILAWAVRSVFGLSSIVACGWISVAACSLALVGWFTWVKRCLPRGISGTLLALVAGGCSVAAAWLINPSTDVLLSAVLPFALLATSEGIKRATEGPHANRRALAWLGLAGLLAGGLFWIRYASAFVPLAIGAYLLLERWPRRRIQLGHIVAFVVCAATPIVTLLLVNRMFGVGSAQAQLNLGHRIGFDFSLHKLAQAWWTFTNFGFYSHRPLVHWMFALWPIVLGIATLGVAPIRAKLRAFLTSGPVCLSACVVACLLFILVTATALFGDKFDYVAMERYYVPIRPLYFLLFVGPMLTLPWRVVRMPLFVCLLVGCSWLGQHEWPRPYKRWLTADRATTPYGRWARAFDPGAAELYEWLKRSTSPDLVVVSNFHEYITLETGLAALPIPPDVAALNTWVRGIADARGIDEPRVLFVLDPSNRWRDYWIPAPASVIRDFNLTRRAAAPPEVSADVFWLVSAEASASSSTSMTSSRHVRPRAGE